MSTHDQEGNAKMSESMVSDFFSTGPGLVTDCEFQAREAERSRWNELVGHKTSPSSPARTPTGPRTTAGKQRSRYNALKSGIFAKVVLLKGESAAVYGSLLKGLQEYFQPQGTLEAALVEYLAVLLWRKRRLLRAESAEITNAIGFKSIDSVQAQLLEIWDRSRTGETAGGMLRHSSNPFLIGQAVDILKTFRGLFEKSGFVRGEDPWLLRKLYGLDHDGAAPLGIFRTFQLYTMLATDAPKGNETPHSPDELKKEMLEMLDEEIRHLEGLKVLQQTIEEQKAECQTIAALVPSQDVTERLVRYEAHLSREFDRTLSQLERLRRIRLGQPVPPTVRLELSR
jgi:hypothetical protein